MHVSSVAIRTRLGSRFASPRIVVCRSQSARFRIAAVHALAYPIGAIFHVPHGLSNALVLTQVLRFNLPEAEGLYAELAPIVDPKSQGMNVSQRARLFVDAIAAICRDCNVPASLADVGIARSDLKKLAEDAMKQTRLLVNNPREVSFDGAKLLVADLADVIKSKRAAGRPRDLANLDILEKALHEETRIKKRKTGRSEERK